MSHEQLIILWFILEAVLWIGFFFLEGFDFGVSLLYPVLGKDPTERRVMVNAIGPTWDGNEVWLLTAGGAMFAAFPGWYSTLFSGLYMPLLLVLLGLIARGVSFEYRALNPNDSWRDAFDWAATIGSFIVSLVLGIGFTNMWIGMPVAGDPALMTQSFWSLFSPLALFGGVTVVVLFMVHGAIFLSLKTDGVVRENAHALVKKLGPAAFALVAVFVVWANIAYPGSLNPYLGTSVPTWIIGGLAIAALGFAVMMHIKRREKSAFFGTGLTIAALFAGIFVKMYGSLGFIAAEGTNFNAEVAASSPATLSLMSVAALIGVPIVLAYTIWSYYVFRKRLTVEMMPPEPSEVAKKLAVAQG